MAAGKWASLRNGTKSTASSSCRVAVTTGRSKWLSAVARPCPGICLMTGSTPPPRHGGTHPRYVLLPLRVGPVADDAMAAGRRHVHQWGAVRVDADCAQ